MLCQNILTASVFILTWLLFSAPEDNFSVLSPGKMDRKYSQVDTDIGYIKETMYSYKDTSMITDNELYMISVTTYPEDLIFSMADSIAEILADTHINEASHALGGQLIYRDDITLQGMQGKIYRISYNEGAASVKGKVFLNGIKLYSIRVFTRKSKANNADINRFLESFRWQVAGF